MKTRPKFNIKLICLLLVSIFALTAVFGILNKANSKKDNSRARITALEQSLSEAQNEILTKNAVLEQKNTTISEQNAVIENQRATINSQSETIEDQLNTISNLEEELSSEYNYQYSIDVDFYVDSVLYMSGKARNGGTILVSPTAPTKSGYTFTGWALTENGTVVDLTNTTITQATTFYAVFEYISINPDDPNIEDPSYPTIDPLDPMPDPNDPDAPD